MIKRYPATTDANVIERELHDVSDGEVHMVAVEVFGPPEAMRYIKSEDTEGGPWLIGAAAEVYAEAEASGFDYETQYQTGEPYDG